MVFTHCLCKAIVLGFNIVIVISASAILALGVALKSVLDIMPDFDNGIAPPGSITIGTVVAAFCVIGLVGTCLENRFLIKIFAIAMIITFMLQLILAVMILKSLENTKKDISNAIMALALKSISRLRKGAISQADTAQKMMKCCGRKGPQEYIQQRLEMPTSCCRTATMTCDLEDAHQVGCSYAITVSVITYLKTMGIVMSFFSVVQLFTACFILVLFLCRKI